MMSGTMIYEFLKDIGALAGLGWLLKTLWAAFTNRLRRIEKQLLVAATIGDQLIHHNNFPNIGYPWVKAGDFDLGNNALTEAQFVEALHRLARLEYVREVKPDLFTLTAKGIRMAALLKPKIKLEHIPSAQNSNDTHPKKQRPVPGAYVAND
jgi:hypothetical protein